MEQFIEGKTENEAYVAEANEVDDEGTQELPLNKFKDVQSLQKAYGSLQAEFTKRSQKLKELLRERDELSDLLKTKDNSFNEDRLNRERCAVQFKNEFPEAQEIFNNQAEKPGKSSSFEDLAVAYVRQLKNQLLEQQQKLFNEDFLYSQIEGSAIKDKIIKSYLSNVKNCVEVKKLLNGGGEFALAPPIKPRTIEEAGRLAKDILIRKN